MNYTEHKIMLDLTKTVSQVAISVKKGDTGRRLLIHLAEKGYPYHISADCYAVFTAKKPDGNVVFNGCTIEDCVIHYDITEQTVAVAGMVDCEIILYGSDGKQLTSASFHIIVEDTIYDTETEIESTDEYNALSELIAQVHTVVTKGLAAPPIIGKATGEVIHVSDASDKALQGLCIFGKSTQAAEPTLDAPVEIVSLGASSNIAVKLAGRNLLANKITTNVTDAIAVTSNADGTMTLTGTTIESKRDLYLFGAWASTEDFGVRGAVTLSVEGDDDLTLYIIHNSEVTASGKKTVTMNVTDENYITAIFMRLVRDVTYDETIKVMLSAGTTAPEWEPYKEPQVLTLATPSVLPGIPVDSGGNYTDSDGQQWICDEVDLARGVYVHRLMRMVLSGSEGFTLGTRGTFNLILADAMLIDPSNQTTFVGMLCDSYAANSWNGISLHGEEGCALLWGHGIGFRDNRFSTVDEFKTYLSENPVTVLYALDDFVETALTAEEIAAFAALHTYKPNTTIFNNVGAHMVAEYVADTKTYIDRRPGGSSGSAATIGEVTILADAWVGEESPYSQVVEIDGVTECSQVDLTPSVEQLAIFHNKDLALVTENEDGVVTVYAIGQKPENDYTIQVTMTEVSV